MTHAAQTDPNAVDPIERPYNLPLSSVSGLPGWALRRGILWDVCDTVGPAGSPCFEIRPLDQPREGAPTMGRAVLGRWQLGCDAQAALLVVELATNARNDLPIAVVEDARVALAEVATQSGNGASVVVSAPALVRGQDGEPVAEGYDNSTGVPGNVVVSWEGQQLPMSMAWLEVDPYDENATEPQAVRGNNEMEMAALMTLAESCGATDPEMCTFIDDQGRHWMPFAVPLATDYPVGIVPFTEQQEMV